MAITFFTQSVKQIAPIFIRYRELSVDAKARTNLYIDKDRLKGSKVLKHKMSAKDNQEQKLLIKEKNKALDKVQNEMQLLEIRIRSLITEDTLVNSAWLKQALKPKQKQVKKTLEDYYNDFIDTKQNRSKQTQSGYRGSRNFMMKYQADILKRTLYISHIDSNFKDDFIKHCRTENYPESTIKYHLARLKQVCSYAEQRGETISNQVKHLTRGIKKKPTESVYLSFKEIDDIIALELEDKLLDAARDWLVISCYTGQRSATFLNLTKKDIDAKSQCIKVKQVKTKVFVTIPILPPVQAIIDKHDGFPPRLHKSDKYNYNYYNDYIKTVCKLAGLTELCTARNTKRNSDNSDITEKPKYKLVSSHTGRRSFCTNLYGKMPTAEIMQISGHRSESSFLLYINKGREINIDSVRSQMLDALK